MPGLKQEEQTIEAPLSYSVIPESKKPFTWINQPPAGEKSTNVELVDHQYNISDLRHSTIDYGLDTTGFDLLSKTTQMKYDDYADDERVRTLYYPEIQKLFKDKLGATKVTIFDHTIRRQPPKGVVVDDTPDSRQPVSRVHVDQTPESARNRVKRHDPEQAEALLKGRVRLINVWRPLKGPVLDTPLAVADFRTMSPKGDLVPSDLIYSPEQIGETYVIRHNPEHKWYYASNMQPDEILLLKCFDSRSEVTNPTEGIASLTPHTAFQDPRYYGSADVEPRESIEVRALVYTD